MRKLFFILFAVPALFFAGCSSDDNPNITPTLEVTPASLNLSDVAGAKTFNISSTVSWNIASSQTWCTVDVKEGSGNKTITVTLTANTNPDDRIATITAKATNGEIADKTVEIKQLGFNPKIVISPANLDLDFSEQIVDVDVTANVEYDVTIPQNANWLTQVAPTSKAVDKLSFKVTTNTGGTARTAEVTFKQKSGLATATLVVTQSGLDEAKLEVFPKEREFLDADEHIFLVRLTTNLPDFEVSTPEWIEHIIDAETTATTEDLLMRFKVFANTTATKRSGNIIIKGKGIDLSEEVTINQSGIRDVSGSRFAALLGKMNYKYTLWSTFNSPIIKNVTVSFILDENEDDVIWIDRLIEAPGDVYACQPKPLKVKVTETETEFVLTMDFPQDAGTGDVYWEPNGVPKSEKKTPLTYTLSYLDPPVDPSLGGKYYVPDPIDTPISVVAKTSKNNIRVSFSNLNRGLTCVLNSKTTGTWFPTNISAWPNSPVFTPLP